MVVGKKRMHTVLDCNMHWLSGTGAAVVAGTLDSAPRSYAGSAATGIDGLRRCASAVTTFRERNGASMAHPEPWLVHKKSDGSNGDLERRR
jgi:hypothetical protein